MAFLQRFTVFLFPLVLLMAGTGVWAQAAPKEQPQGDAETGTPGTEEVAAEEKSKDAGRHGYITQINKNNKRHYIEYNRGRSSLTVADINLVYRNNDVTFHDVVLNDRSFSPDDNAFPSTYFENLATLKIGQSFKTLTESYYGIRYFYFLPDDPSIGIGFDFTHFKVYMDNYNQRVRRTGKANGGKVNDYVLLKDHFKEFNISHGVNHLNAAIHYRISFFPTKDIPEGRLQPYIGFATGPIVPHTQLTVVNAAGRSSKKIDSFGYGFPNWGFDFSLGVRWQMFEHFGIYMAYKYSYSHLHAIGFDNEEGEVNTDFWVNHILWGIFVAF